MNTATPYISIIIPTYNVAAFIRECIDSVLKQTIMNYEVLIVDDCSTDNTWHILNTYTDPRIKKWRHAKNTGPGAARNTALQHAQGAWIVFLDGDDWMHPTRLETLCTAEFEKKYDWIIDDAYILRDSSSNQYLPTLFAHVDIQANKPFTLTEHLRTTPAIHPVVKKAFLDKYQLRFCEDITRAEDFELWMFLHIHGAKAHLVPTPLYTYRIRAQSFTWDTQRVVGRMRSSCEYLATHAPHTLQLLFHAQSIIYAKKEQIYALYVQKNWLGLIPFIFFIARFYIKKYIQ